MGLDFDDDEPCLARKFSSLSLCNLNGLFLGGEGERRAVSASGVGGFLEDFLGDFEKKFIGKSGVLKYQDKAVFGILEVPCPSTNLWFPQPAVVVLQR